MSASSLWKRLSGPCKVGIVFAVVAVVLTVVGQLRQPDSITFRSLAMGTLIGGGSWGLVAWAIAYAAWDVESELADTDSAERTPADEASASG